MWLSREGVHSRACSPARHSDGSRHQNRARRTIQSGGIDDTRDGAPAPPTHMCTCRLMGARICSHVFALVMRRRHPAHRGLRHYHDRGHRLHRHHRRAAAFFAVPVSLQHAPCSGICVCSTGPRSRPICARSGQFMLLFRWRLLWVTVGRGGTVLERTCAFVRVCTLSSGFPVPDLSCGTCETVENAVVCSCRSIL